MFQLFCLIQVAFDIKNVVPAAYLFEEQDSVYDFPAKYWIEWLKVNEINYKKYKK